MGASTAQIAHCVSKCTKRRPEARGSSCPSLASSSAAFSATTSMRSSCAVIIPKSMTLASMTSRRCASVCAMARDIRRAARGKGAPRGESFPGTAEQPLQRKQVFAAALKRVSKEIGRMQKLEARGAHVEAARRALAMRRAAQFPPRPPSGETANEGMRALPNRRRRTRIPPAKIGSVSQATKDAQAARDARNRSVQ